MKCSSRLRSKDSGLGVSVGFKGCWAAQTFKAQKGPLWLSSDNCKVLNMCREVAEILVLSTIGAYGLGVSGLRALEFRALGFSVYRVLGSRAFGFRA